MTRWAAAGLVPHGQAQRGRIAYPDEEVLRHGEALLRERLPD